MRDFERNGMNLTLTKREEMQRLKVQIDGLSLQYIQNLSDDSTFLLFSEAELAGLPPEFLEVQSSMHCLDANYCTLIIFLTLL